MRHRIGSFRGCDTGKSTHFVGGWRDFDIGHPDCVLHNGASAGSPAFINSAVTQADRSIAFTIVDSTTGATTLQNMDVYTLPLLRKDGKPVTFADSFCFKTQIEVVSHSGDIGHSTNFYQPVIAMALGQSTDVDHTDNHYVGTGFVGKRFESSQVKWRRRDYRTNGANSHTYGNDTANINNDFRQWVSDYFIGPCIGADAAETNTVSIQNTVYKNATNSYVKNNTVIMNNEVMNPDAGVFDVDTQVYVYLMVGCESNANGSNDAATITVRCRYLVDGHDGKAGTGAA